MSEFPRFFNAELFLEALEHWPEGPQVDFKREVYRLGKRNEEAQGKFARHLIALANVARRTGEPSWIFFGVDDQDRSQIFDVSGHSSMDVDPGYWGDPQVSTAKKQSDAVETVFVDCARKWIDPGPPQFHLEYGEIRGKVVSYLEIMPSRSLDPFKLKRPMGTFPAGTIFIRQGSSSVPVGAEEAQYLLSISEVEYLRQDDWRRMITAHKTGDFEKSQVLAPPFQPKVREEPTQALDAILQALDGGTQIIQVVAQAGEGKTVLLHRVAYALASRFNSELPTRHATFGQHEGKVDEDEPLRSVINDLEVVPSFAMPVFMPLRTTFDTKADFECLLLRRIGLAASRPDEFDSISRLVKIPGSRWVFLLDGVDELRNREKAGAILGEWLQVLPRNVQVVIASRPYATNAEMEGLYLELAPLTAEEIIYLLSGKLHQADLEQDDETITSLKVSVQQNPTLLELLARQRAVDGLIRFLVRDAASSQMRTPMDGDVVEVIEKQTVSVQLEGEEELPRAISAEALENDGSLLVEPEANEGQVGNDGPPFQLALAVQFIMNHMREEEVKRRREYGVNPRVLADRAAYELGEVAWRLDWFAESFDSVRCTRQGWLHPDCLDWNTFIGFTVPERYPCYRFSCWLLPKYAAAEYAYNLNDMDLVRTNALRRDPRSATTQFVVRLYNELRSANGREVLAFT